MDMAAEALERLFCERVKPEVVRDIERGGDIAPLWKEISGSGFLDILLPEDAGGTGLPLGEAFASFFLAGRYALPFPFVQTAMVRAWLHTLGVPSPQGAIAIAGPETAADASGGLSAYSVAYGKTANWVLAQFSDLWVLLPSADAQVDNDGTRGSQMADLHWPFLPEAALNLSHAYHLACSPVQLAAAALTPLLAGAARQALDMTLAYVAEREQFGRPIAQFQAVQGQISLMAERVWAMRMAARMAFHASGALPSFRLAAIGKARCSEAAVLVADIAHALHGAIGITEEYDLQLYTRRLREWRKAGGTETWWARQIGREVIERSEGSALDFILSCTRT